MSSSTVLLSVTDRQKKMELVFPQKVLEKLNQWLQLDSKIENFTSCIGEITETQLGKVEILLI
jgi:hypothetical protein